MLQQARWHIQVLQYWKAFDLLRKARAAGASSEVARTLAQALASKGACTIRLADALRIYPGSLLSEEELLEAIEVDPTVGETYWVLAISRGRYHADFDAASKYLDQAEACGYMPPDMSRLRMLIENKVHAGNLPDNDENRLRHLVLRLALHYSGPFAYTLQENAESGLPVSPELQTFGDYVREGTAIASRASISEETYLGILDACRAIEGDPYDYVTDLLRRVAAATDARTFLNRATDAHLRVIAKQAFMHSGRVSSDPAELKRALKAAKRGLDIIETTMAAVDPDTHADLLIARGQALYLRNQENAISAMRDFHRALQLKRQAGNVRDAERCRAILWQAIDRRAGLAMASGVMGGFRESLDFLEAALEILDDLGDPLRAARIVLLTASVKRQAGQYAEAEQLLLDLLNAAPSAAIAAEAQFELASIYSETRRPTEAASLQKKLIDEAAMDPEDHSVLWSNYGNSLRLLGRAGEARQAFERAWELLPAEEKERTGAKIPAEGARLQTLLADLACREGDLSGAQEFLAKAESLDETPIGIAGLYRAEIKAQLMTALGRPAAALGELDRALQNFRFLLENGPSLPAWESLLQKWSHLDGLAIRLHLESGRPGGAEAALTRAEAAKGRVLAWMERFAAPKGAQWALDPERQTKALEDARRWVDQKARRKVISFFGSRAGLALFSLGDGGVVNAVWRSDINYDLIRADLYEPWLRVTERAMSGGDASDAQLAASQTNYALDLAGAWLAAAFPDLMKGGTDLVIVPHRLFRNLPLTHARLPNGTRLSELFESVLIAPTLGEFTRAAGRADKHSLSADAIALADPDGSLPFAQCEAILFAANDEQVHTGNAVTQEAVIQALDSDGLLILSMHGDFDEGNPFNSRLFVAGEAFQPLRLLLGQTRLRCHTIILGVCEGGRSRHTLSDEPFGFPAMLLQAGAAAVLAPAWPVDDFASFLFMARLSEHLDSGRGLCRAAAETARWLRELTAREALAETGRLTAKIAARGEIGVRALENAGPRLVTQRSWLEGLEPEETPFRSPLDWAAFQVTGLPPNSA
jgi:CHAT domain-containing protein